MKLNSFFSRLGNVFARIFGLGFTAAGCYFSAQGIYYLFNPDMTGYQGQLPLPPSFRPVILAVICLIIGVHFVRGEAHRPDLPDEEKLVRAKNGRTHSWWTGEPLEKNGK